MGDYAVSYEHTGDVEVKYVVHEDWSWMDNTGPEDAGPVKEGESFYEEYDIEEELYDSKEEEYNYEAGFNFEYSYTCDSGLPVAVEGGSEPTRSASKSHQVAVVEDTSESSESSQDDKPKLKPKTKKTKGSRKQFKHLQDSPLDASSDPGYGGSSENFHSEDARSMSISVVSSWLQDAALDEHPKDGTLTIHGSIPPQRRPAPRRPPPGADMGAYASRRSSSLPGPVPQYEYEAEECGKTPAWDPSESQSQGYEEDNRVAVRDASADMPSIYRQEAKGLDKALKIMRTGAVGFALASRTAAIGLGSASKAAAVAVQRRTKEMRCLAVPVFTPLIQAVVEESKEHLMGPDPDASTGRGRGRGRGRGPGRGRGRGPGGPPMLRPTQPMMGPGMMPPGPRPGMRPVMRPGTMPAGPRPGMRPVMRPGTMPAGPRPGMRPVMRPGMPAGPGPGIRPVMRPGMPAGPGPGMRPVMRPGMRPGMGPPPGNQQGLAPRGQFRPVGPRPVPPQLTDY